MINGSSNVAAKGAGKTTKKKAKGQQRRLKTGTKKNLKRLERNDKIYAYRNSLMAKLKDWIKSKRVDKTLFNSTPKCMLKVLNERLETCNYICSCCEGLFYSKSVRKITNARKAALKLSMGSNYSAIMNYESENNNYFCLTCDYHIKKKKVPDMATSNGLGFRDLPEYLTDLTPLEERLVSPVLPFLYIMPLLKTQLYGELGMRGSVVCIPIDLNTSVEVLPRQFNESSVIQVKLKRMISHASHYMFETVRPDRIKKSIEYLVNTTLYKDLNIKIDLEYLEEMCQYETIPFVVQEEDKDILQAIDSDNESDLASDCSEICEDLVEDDAVINDRYENLNNDKDSDNNNNIQIIAPGEGKRPIPWLKNENIFHICFPSIFGGENDIRRDGETGKLVVSITKMAKSYIRNYKLKCGVPIVIFFLYCMKMEHHVSSTIAVCMRKSKTKHVRAKNVVEKNYVTNLVAHNNAFNFLQTVKFTPAYFHKLFKNVLAMIRQLGAPTFFITLSCAERTWPEILQQAAALTGRKMTEQEALNMDESEKCKLIRDNPTLFVRYYDKKVADLIKFLKEENGPFGANFVVDYTLRKESHKRGALHTHTLQWLKGAPDLVVGDAESEKKFIDFTDRFVTCQNDFEDPYVALQKHSHTKTCYKYGERCRFGYPLPVMPKTCILSPLPKDVENLKEKKAMCVTIHNYMIDLSKNEKDISFEDMLKELNVSEEDYYLAIRSSLKRPKFFFRRDSR